MKKEISLLSDNSSDEAKLIGFLLPFAISSLLCVMFCYGMVENFVFIIDITICAVITVICKVLGKDTFRWVVVTALILLISLMIGMCFSTAVGSALTKYLNELINAWNQKKGTMLYLYEVEKDADMGMMVLSMLITVLMALMINLFVKLKWISAIVVVEFLSFSLLVTRTVKTGLLEVILFAFAVLTTIVSDVIKSGRGKRVVYAFSIIMVIMALITLTVGLASKYILKDHLNNFRDNMISSIEDRIYGKTDLCNGKLYKAGPKPQSDEIRMIFETKDNSKSLYLKGYVGSKYTGDKWNELDVGAYNGDNMDMIHWLNEHRESPLTMLGIFLTISNAYEKNTIDFKAKKFSVENLSASSRYLYIPYTCSNVGFAYYEDIYKDSMVRNESKLRSYSGTYMDISFNLFLGLNNNGALTDDDVVDTYKTHFQCEKEYRDYVQKYYLEVPDRISDFLDSIFLRNNANLAEATFSIRQYLLDNMTYNERPSNLPAGKDFALYYLTEAKEGYSVQYASIAVLMFRYFGIPARYAEGYIANVIGNKAEISAKDAHAWVEVYRYGMGWIPVEVTPGYYNADAILDIKPQSLVKPQTPEVQTMERPKGTSSEEELSRINNGKSFSVFFLVMILTIIIILIIIILLTRRLIIMAVRKRKYVGYDLNQKALFMAGFIYRIASYTGIDISGSAPMDAKEKMDEAFEEYSKVKFVTIVELLGKAKYSQEMIEASSEKMVFDYFISEKNSFRNKVGPFKYLKVKYLNVII